MNRDKSEMEDDLQKCFLLLMRLTKH